MKELLLRDQGSQQRLIHFTPLTTTMAAPPLLQQALFPLMTKTQSVPSLALWARAGLLPYVALVPHSGPNTGF